MGGGGYFPLNGIAILRLYHKCHVHVLVGGKWRQPTLNAAIPKQTTAPSLPRLVPSSLNGLHTRAFLEHAKYSCADE